MKWTDGKVCCICGEFDDEVDNIDDLIRMDSGNYYCPRHAKELEEEDL